MSSSPKHEGVKFSDTTRVIFRFVSKSLKHVAHVERLACALPLAFSIALLILPLHAHSDQRRESDSPFKIEDFSPKKGRYTLSAGLGYSVSDSRKVSVSTVAAPIGHGFALLLPEVSVDDRRRDALFARLGLRHALNERLNVSLGLKVDVSRSVIRENSAQRVEHERGWRTLSVGADYRISTHFDQPYVLAFAELALAEKSGGETLSGKSATFGASSHWAYDPVILSLTGTYTHLASRKIDGKRRDPGDIVGLAASFGLAVNPEVSFRAGLSQSFRGGDRFADKKDDWRSATALTLGYTHRLSPRLVMNVSAEAGVAGHDAAQTFVNFTWRP